LLASMTGSREFEEILYISSYSINKFVKKLSINNIKEEKF